MIKLIERLVAKGVAYPLDGDVYFEVKRFPRYGRLSGKNLDELQAGGRGGGGGGSRPARARGGPAAPAGTSSARPCPCSTWGRALTSTPAGKTSCSPTTRTRSPSRRQPRGAPSSATGSTTGS